MHVRHSPRQSIFNFPELANLDLVEKLNKKGEPDVAFHVKIGRFTVMVNTYCGAVNYSLVDIPEGTEFWLVRQAYRNLLSVLGRDIKKEPARIHDVGLYAYTHHSNKKDILEKILANKRVKMKIGKKPFEFNEEKLLIGKVGNSKDTYLIRSELYTDSEKKYPATPYIFNAQIYGESGRGNNTKGRFKDLEILNDVLECHSD